MEPHRQRAAGLVKHSLAGIVINGQPKYFLFGGLTSGGQPSAATWVNDGSSWDPRGQTGARPSARSAQGMVGGQLGGQPKIWVFGGTDGVSQLSDLWSYDPAADQWTFLGPQQGQPAGTWPSARSSHAISFVQGDYPGDERLYVFGGRTGSSAFASDLWRFNPNTAAWERLLPTTSPGARRDAAMAYVPGEGALMLFGGRSSANAALSDTWTYDPSATAWTLRASANSPAGRSEHAVSVDASGDKLVLTGGVDATGQPLVGTWVWDSLAPGNPSGAWVEQLPVPSPRSGAALAFDRSASRLRHVMFGGSSAATGTVTDETWELEGVNWRRRNPSTRPSARTDAGIVYHAGLDRVVLFGGRNQNGSSLGDTWEWNGSSWSISSATGAPPAGGGMQPVYDTTRGRIVMPIAGASGMETWTLASAAWSQVSTPVIPPGRTNFGCAYDPRRDQVVLFGGMSSDARASATYNNETWIFDGTTWVRRFSANSPSPRGWCKLSYDDARSRIVLFGGANAGTVFDETWEWDGSNWLQQTPSTSPSNASVAYGHAPSYDTQRSVTVAHGVLGTWDYGPVAPSEVVAYGPAGCTTSANAPLQIKQLGWSRLWLGERLELDIEGAPSASLGLMLWGLSNTSFGGGVPLPLDLRLINFSTGPCYLSTSADIATEAVFPGTTRYQSFGMPFDPFLLGVQLYLQAAYFDAGANPTNPPVVTSNALRMSLGQKGATVAAPFEPNPALNMVGIGAGTFLMGAVAGLAVEQPVHPVTITRPFWIGKHEVTQAQYQAVMGGNPSFHRDPGAYPNAAQRPVEQVSWNDAMAYCSALTATESAAGRIPVGYQYRLPTEAEWEYVCRAGTTTEWNTGASLTTAQANFNFTLSQTTVVGIYPANPWGLFDTHGNVWEWCLDAAWDGNPNYPSSAVSDPYVSSGPYRVYRGGGWGSPSFDCRSAFRYYYGPPGNSTYSVGFRVVLAPVLVP